MPDLREDARWPVFGPQVVRDLDVRSMVSFQIYVDEASLGAINAYAAPAGAFDDQAVAQMGILAAHAALAFVRTRAAGRVEHLTAALQTNRTIGVAMGVLMARLGIAQDEAFERLRLVSQATNRKLRDIADEVVLTGALPEAPPRRR